MNDGFGKLDLKCVVFDNRTVLVKRLTPGEDHGGNFVVYLDADRVSEAHHASRMDAIAEAERFVYGQPQFAGSNAAAAINAALSMGRQAFRDGQSIYANPFDNSNQSVDRVQWITGWMEEFGVTNAQKLLIAAEATARANLQLESDNKYLIAAARAYRLAINFVANKTGTEGDWRPKEGIAFLVEWMTSDDAEGFDKKYPEWKEYRSNDPRANPVEPVAVN